MHTVNVFKKCAAIRSAVAIEDHQYLPHLANIPGVSATCTFRKRFAAWDHRTLPRLTSSCIHMVNIHSDGFAIRYLLLSVWCTRVKVHWDGVAIRNYLLLSHQFYAHNWMSTEMAFESEIVCCSLISFIDTSECPPRWHCNQKSSVAVSSVLCTQASLHWDSVAIRNHLLPSHQFYAHKWISTKMAFQSQIIRCYLVSFMQFHQFLITFMHTSKCPLRRCCHQGSSITATSHKQFFCIQ